MLHRRRHARGIRHAIRVRGKTLTALRLVLDEDGRTRNVARSDDHGKAQLKPALVVADRFLIFDFDRDPIVWGDIRHRCRKDVGPFLFNQAGALAFLLGLFIDLLRFGSFLDLAFDEALADLHAQVIDGGSLRQGKHIDPLRPVLSLVREFLFDDGSRDHTSHRDLHVGLEGGRRDESSGLTGAKEQPALLHVAEADSPFEGGWFLSAGVEDR